MPICIKDTFINTTESSLKNCMTEDFLKFCLLY